MFKSKITLTLSIFVLLIIAACVASSALSDFLDDYAGTDFTSAGKLSVDSFIITEGDFYCEHRITDSQRWIGGGTAEMQLTPYVRTIFGFENTYVSAYVAKEPQDTSYSIVSFTNFSNGEYKIYFKSTYQDTVDFDGTVYDSN